MTQKKEFQDLDLTDAFLFAAALEDPETCRLVLELIFGRSIGSVEVQAERSALFSKDFRYVRFDVYAADDVKVVYDLEMQNSHKEELPKHARYHQAEMDATYLKSGQQFQGLPESAVVFICTYDPFHSNLYRYIFEERCRETGENLGDGTFKIFLNTKGTNESEVPPELVHFLQYVVSSTAECAEETQDTKVRDLNRRVEMLKQSRRLKEEYMTMQEMLDDSKREGWAEGKAAGKAEGKLAGKAEGEDTILTLVSLLLRDGRAAELEKLKTDKPLCAQLLKEYHLD